MKKCNINKYRTKAFENGVMHPQPLFIDSCQDCGWFNPVTRGSKWSPGTCTANEAAPVFIGSPVIPDSCPLDDVVIGDSGNTIGVIGVIGLSAMFFVIGVISVLLVLGVVQ